MLLMRKFSCWLSAVVLAGVLVSCSDSKPKVEAAMTQAPAPPLVVSMDTNDLVEVKTVITNVVLDIRYATSNNFTGQTLYTSSRCFLRKSVVANLAKAQKEFNELGYGIKIFDGYRPLTVQKKMWAVYPNPGFVADPKKGSKHNRGAAVDLTLVKLGEGEVLMPTPFDDFTEKAHRNYQGGPEESLHNKKLLETVMERNGFKGLDTEWWHFDDLNWRKYDVMDVPVE